jgi:hypothetical protein
MAIDAQPLSRTLLHRFTRLMERCSRVCLGAAKPRYAFYTEGETKKG